MNLVTLFIILWAVIEVANIIFITIADMDDTFIEVSWFFLIGVITLLIFGGISETGPYQRHQLKYWEKQIVKIERKIERTESEIDRKYLFTKDLTKAQDSYDYYYEELFEETPYKTARESAQVKNNEENKD